MCGVPSTLQLRKAWGEGTTTINSTTATATLSRRSRKKAFTMSLRHAALLCLCVQMIEAATESGKIDLLPPGKRVWAALSVVEDDLITKVTLRGNQPDGACNTTVDVSVAWIATRRFKWNSTMVWELYRVPGYSPYGRYYILEAEVASDGCLGSLEYELEYGVPGVTRTKSFAPGVTCATFAPNETMVSSKRLFEIQGRIASEKAKYKEMGWTGVLPQPGGSCVRSSSGLPWSTLGDVQVRSFAEPAPVLPTYTPETKPPLPRGTTEVTSSESQTSYGPGAFKFDIPLDDFRPFPSCDGKSFFSTTMRVAAAAANPSCPVASVKVTGDAQLTVPFGGTAEVAFTSTTRRTVSLQVNDVSLGCKVTLTVTLVGHTVTQYTETSILQGVPSKLPNDQTMYVEDVVDYPDDAVVLFLSSPYPANPVTLQVNYKSGYPYGEQQMEFSMWSPGRTLFRSSCRIFTEDCTPVTACVAHLPKSQ